MVFKYTVVAGCFSIPKSIFIKEILGGNTLLKAVFKWKSISNSLESNPMISEKGDGTVEITFSSDNSVCLEDDPREIFKRLKEKYAEKITGRVSCMCTYELMSSVVFIDIDLNSVN